MSDTFEVGEVALVNKADSPWYGREVTVTGPLRITTYLDIHTGVIWPAEPCYDITLSWKPGPYVSPPRFLRKKRPPPKKEDIGEWELCPWRPEGVSVNGT